MKTQMKPEGTAPRRPKEAWSSLMRPLLHSFEDAAQEGHKGYGACLEV